MSGTVDTMNITTHAFNGLMTKMKKGKLSYSDTLEFEKKKKIVYDVGKRRVRQSLAAAHRTAKHKRKGETSKNCRNKSADADEVCFAGTCLQGPHPLSPLTVFFAFLAGLYVHPSSLHPSSISRMADEDPHPSSISVVFERSAGWDNNRGQTVIPCSKLNLVFLILFFEVPFYNSKCIIKINLSTGTRT
eukprot:SAG31_NODE_11333_length_1041_cov_2.525478_1_plen_189_part_00